MKILALESSAVSAGAAICEDGKLLGESFINIGLTHSQTLLTLVNQVLESTNLSHSDIDVYAVSAGPGSFTGIRIGVATVKGFAFANDKPCYGISTLEAMAWSVAGSNTLICPVMDARCMQVYTAIFQSTNGNIIRLTEDDAIKVDALADLLKMQKRKTMLIGDGAEKFFDKLKDAGADVYLAPCSIRQQHASGVAIAAWQYKCNGTEPIQSAQLVPCYLRLSQAERERQNKLKGE